MRLPILQAVVTLFGVLLWIEGYAQAEVKVKADKTYKPFDKIVLEAGDLPKGTPRIVWRVENGAQWEKSTDGRFLYVWAKPGRYKVRLTVIEFKSEFFEEVETTITVEGETPPGPGPDPAPVDKVKVPQVVGTPVVDAKVVLAEAGLKASVKGSGQRVTEQSPEAGAEVARGSTVSLTAADIPPVNGTAPIKAHGFRVLIVEESKDRSKLPAEQRAILFNKQLRDWLRDNTVKDAENPNGSWYIFDQHDDLSQYPQYWQDAMKRKRDSVPWILVSNGVTGYEGPLPKSVQETMDLMKKYLPKAGMYKKGGK